MHVTVKSDEDGPCEFWIFVRNSFPRNSTDLIILAYDFGEIKENEEI